MGGEYSINPFVNTMQTLRNYEYMLYGGSNYGTTAPSYTNNYVGATNYNNPYSYNNYLTGNNTVFRGYTNGYGNATGTTSAGASFQGLTNEDMQVLKNYYNKGLSPSESLGSALISGGVLGALLNNPRIIAHLPQTLKATSATNKIFADCKKEGTALYNLWRGKETNGLMQDFYAAVNKLEARNHRKIGAFRKRYSTEDYNTLKQIVDEAIASGNENKIAEATAKLKNAYVTDGWLARIFKKPKSVATAIGETDAISAKVTELLQTSKGLGFKQALAKGGGIKGGIMMMAIEYLIGIGNIISAFNKDSSTGMKQLGQTTIKAAGNAAGWALGEAAAVWAMGKAGATIGTMFGPGIGTIIGGAIGVVGGSLGMWIAGKITRAIVGQDVGEKVATDTLVSTVDGQEKLIKDVIQRAQNGEKMDAATQHVVQKAMNLYA